MKRIQKIGMDALSVGAFRRINFMGLGVQIGVYEYND